MADTLEQPCANSHSRSSALEHARIENLESKPPIDFRYETNTDKICYLYVRSHIVPTQYLLLFLTTEGAIVLEGYIPPTEPLLQLFLKVRLRVVGGESCLLTFAFAFSIALESLPSFPSHRNIIMAVLCLKENFLSRELEMASDSGPAA
jgi:hypothetical protein